MSPSRLPEPSDDERRHSEALAAVIRGEIRRAGPIDFQRWMQLCLYAPGLGYYSAGRAKFGPAGDFVTAPELGPLFARTLAQALAPVLRETGGEVLELGAGSGALAAELLEELAALGAVPVAQDGAVAAVQAAGGADVVLELVGAPNLDRNLEALAVKGRIVVVGIGAGAEAQLSLGKLMGKRAAVHGTTLRARPLEEKAAAVQGFAHEVVPHLAAERMRAIIDRIFPVEEAADAFDYMAGSGKFGKVLLAF